MAARLRQLEGLVRDMLDEDGNVVAVGAPATNVAGEEKDSSPKREMSPAGGQVVSMAGRTTYVGATHFMALLDDVSLSLILMRPELI